MKSFWTAFLLIFVAELGDKTQFMTLALSSRYRALTVLLGVTLATIAVSLVSVGLGEVLGGVLPRAQMNIGAGIIFIIFAILSLKEAFEEKSSEEEQAQKELSKKVGNQHHLVLTIAGTFFIAELADKTMLATIAIASQDKNYFAIWLGSTLGLLFSSCLAILVGKAISKKITGKAMHFTTAIIFIIAGALAIHQGIVPR